MKKIILIGILALLVLIVLFFPKECGHIGSGGSGSYDRLCDCLGFETTGDGTVYCWGICSKCHDIEYD